MGATRDPYSMFSYDQPTSDTGLIKEREMRAAGTLPYDLLNTLNSRYQTGMYDQTALNGILGRLRTAEAMRRRSLYRGLRANMGRRLGSRAGSLDLQVTNQVAPQALLQERDIMGNLFRENEASKSQYLQQIQSLIEMIRSGAQNEWWKGRGSNLAGFGSILSGIGTLAGAAIGGPGGAAVGGAAGEGVSSSGRY